MGLFLIRRISGNSMLPLYKPGRIVIATSFKKCKAGNTVIARVEGKEVIKRVQKIEDNKYWLISDNLAEGRDSRFYGPVKKSHILGTLF